MTTYSEEFIRQQPTAWLRQYYAHKYKDPNAWFWLGRTDLNPSKEEKVIDGGNLDEVVITAKHPVKETMGSKANMSRIWGDGLAPSVNQGEIKAANTALDGTWVGNLFDKVYDWSNKNYSHSLKGSFARTVDGLGNLYNQVREGGLGFLPGIGDAADVVSVGDDLNKGNYGSAALTASLMLLPGSASKVKSGLKYINSNETLSNIYSAIQNIKNTEWYQAVVLQFGKKYADEVVENFSKNPNKLLRFIFAKGEDGFDAAEETLKYTQGRETMSKVRGNLDEGKGLIAGSAAIMNEGSIQRPSAAFHDIDMYILAPGLKSEAELVPKVTDDLDLSTLIDENKLRNLPMFQEILPGMATKKRGIPEEGVTNLFKFTPYKHMDLRKGTGLVRGIYKGYPLDFFPTLVQIPKTSNGIKKGFVSSDVPMQFKYEWKRDKDLKDIAAFKKWGPDNPIVDINTGKTKFSPLSFENGLLNNEGLPIIKAVETYPGSNEAIPAIMNWKGLLRNPLSDNIDLDEFVYKQGGPIHIKEKIKALNSKKFKHENGGCINYLNLF